MRNMLQVCSVDRVARGRVACWGLLAFSFQGTWSEKEERVSLYL